MINNFSDLSFVRQFYVIGVNHKIASLEVREKFTLSEQGVEEIYDLARSKFKFGFLLQTCNRIEIYGNLNQLELTEIWLKNSRANQEDFNSYCYVKKGLDAITHLFQVASGLDSKIIGDFEISGQLKKSIKEAQKLQAIDSNLIRLSQFVFQAVKKIRTETNISSGSASVGYAAVQYAKEYMPHLQDKKILLYGTGKIGSVVCSNILKHTNSDKIVLINRTREKADKLGIKHNIEVKGLEDLNDEVVKADIIIVATNAGEPTITTSQFEKSTDHSDKVIIDLSVPRNVEKSVGSLKGIKVANIEELSEAKSIAIAKRKKDIPRAKNIINTHINEFLSWLKIRHLAPTFLAIKKELELIRTTEIEYHQSKLDEDHLDVETLELITANLMNKIARQCINHLKENHAGSSNPVKTVESIFGITHH